MSTPEALPPTGQTVGVDVGISAFATLSSGEEIENPRHLKLLTEAGLVERHPEGAWVFYRLAEDSGAGQLARDLLSLVRADGEAIARDRGYAIATATAFPVTLDRVAAFAAAAAQNGIDLVPVTALLPPPA